MPTPTAGGIRVKRDDLISVSGGSASTRLDPDIENTYVNQASAYIEREVAPNFGVRTGVVLNARRQPFGTINVSRPLGAYSVPVSVTDPGPDGRLGSADDGGTVSAFGLTDGALARHPVNLTTNLPDSNSDYYTWEITAMRRQHAGWSLLASFTHTWAHEAALGTGNDFTPNALINAAGDTESVQDMAGQSERDAGPAVRLPACAGPSLPVGATVRTHLREHAQLRQRDLQGGADHGQPDA